MKVALAQLNPTVGDFRGNAAKIVETAQAAAAEGADLAIFPELCVPGYPPQDLVHKPSFLAANDEALRALAASAPAGPALLVGCLAANPRARAGGKPLSNAAALIRRGEPPRIVARKCLLPTYDVFDEARYFEPWATPRDNLVEVAGRRIGVTICEDIWNDKEYWQARLYPLDPVEELVAAGAELLVNLSASPWQKGKEGERYRMLRACAARHRRPVVYVNQVGGNASLIFAGGSLAVDAEGTVPFEPMHFHEVVHVVDPFSSPFARSRSEAGSAGFAPGGTEPRGAVVMERVEAALVLGIRDYCRKLGFKRAVLGVSGGIDSSVTAALAVRALGPENVVGISMPSQYSSEGSKTDADRLAENLGFRVERVPIGPLFDLYRETLRPAFQGLPEDVTEENIQARIRGALLMAYSNKHGHLLLTTGNKTECSVGFCTLYGDTCGGLAVLADLWKTEVYALARHMNRDGEAIPPAVIAKPASPELKPGQLSQHHLPPFDVLDPVLAALVEDELGPDAAAAKTGAPAGLVRAVQQKLYAAEYKRFQFAPTLRVSRKAWVGRVYPIVHKFTE